MVRIGIGGVGAGQEVPLGRHRMCSVVFALLTSGQVLLSAGTLVGPAPWLTTLPTARPRQSFVFANVREHNASRSASFWQFIGVRRS